MKRGLLHLIRIEVKDEAAMMPKRHGVMDNLEVLSQDPSSGSTALYLEGKHAGEILHLAPSEFVLRVRRQTGVNDAFNLFVFLQERPNSKRCFLMRAHPQ